MESDFIIFLAMTAKVPIGANRHVIVLPAVAGSVWIYVR